MRDEIFGSWSLERFDIVSPEGVEKPWGENVSGLLIYSKDGHMSVSINRALNNSEPNEAKAIFDSILFYSGTFQIDGNVILHQVTQASNPSRIGKEMIRYAELADGLLVLTTPKESFGTAKLIWRKI